MKQLNELHRRTLEYLSNVGGSISVEAFDDDHAPVGPMLRRDMIVAGLITERAGVIYPTGQTREFLAEGLASS